MMKWMMVRIIYFIDLFFKLFFFLEELFGDFEDLETGEKNKGREEQDDGYDDEMDYDDDDDDDDDKNKEGEEKKLQDKKAKLKSAFDAEYDQSKEPDSAYLDELKKEAEIQTKVIISSFFLI